MINFFIYLLLGIAMVHYHMIHLFKLSYCVHVIVLKANSVLPRYRRNVIEVNTVFAFSVNHNIPTNIN